MTKRVDERLVPVDPGCKAGRRCAGSPVMVLEQLHSLLDETTGKKVQSNLRSAPWRCIDEPAFATLQKSGFSAFGTSESLLL
jgi:hypothetical protein